MGSASKHTVRECDNCSAEIRAYGHRKDTDPIFCSKECERDFYRTTTECEWCGETFEVLKSQLGGEKGIGRYCSTECKDKWLSENWVGEQNPLHIDSSVACANCGDEFQKRPAKIDSHTRHYCSRDCHGEWLSRHNRGENHPRWNGGKADYGEEWYDIRNEVRDRDGYSCEDCGVTEGELGRQLSVHHIRPIRDFESAEEANKLSNLVSLCPSCHSKWEGLYLRPDTR